MELFTLVGLMLAIFGGTYAAIAAMRSHLDTRVETAYRVLKKQITELRRLDQEAAIQEGERHAHCIRKWRRIWIVSHLIPIIFFLIFSMVFAVISYFEWDNMPEKSSWPCCKYIVLAGSIVNLSCVIFAMIAFLVVRAGSRNMDGHMRTALGSEADNLIDPIN